VRIISATHQDLEKCVAEGRFRQDLFYRLNVIELKLPALRDRADDLELLATNILDRLALRSGMPSAPLLASVTLKYLQTYQFPGNVRELENMLERALAFSNGEVILVEDLGLRPSMLREFENERAEVVVKSLSLPNEDPITDSLPDYLDEIERDMILKALNATEQNRTAAARRLGITFRALRYRMQRLEMN
jgi:two-component system, NtrC family, response regulator PilR